MDWALEGAFSNKNQAFCIKLLVFPLKVESHSLHLISPLCYRRLGSWALEPNPSLSD